ncbi:cytochrome P450 704C1 isoform X2 [Amborella trichopoda]|uniref:cytochrome P450 704C1 isoform X2 n=1 Tax=Amborella trichopoda TaxID=13333 RepID=UPI0005D42F54|nr:cytochrome P450 704C1 isoform X2 [Amborella trichopoda]|eukprot:XP_011628395.1 cytochrome P450 704C1 isoform X2 [Amborella trichopoda]
MDFLSLALSTIAGAFSLLLLFKLSTKKLFNSSYPPAVGSIINEIINYRRLYDYHTDLCRNYRTYRLLYPWSSEIYTANPANIEYFLKTNFSNYEKGRSNYEIMSDFLGDGIFTVDGDKWRQQRKLASYEFSTKAVKDYSSHVFTKNAAALAHKVSEIAAPNKVIDMQELLMKSTLDTIFIIGFGVELSSLLGAEENGKAFAEAFNETNALIFWRYVDFLWKFKRFFNVGAEAKLKKSIQTIDELIYKVIHSKRKLISTQDHSNKADILSRFIALSEKEPEKITDKFLRDIIINFMTAGRDTTAVTLSWFLSMVCRNPQVEEKIVEEVRESVKQGNEEERVETIEEFANSLTDAAMDKMPYLHAALSETLRLYPAVPLGGLRMCLGREFAYRQMKITAAILLRFFRFRFKDENKKIKYRTMFTLHIDGGLQLLAFPR